MNNQTTLYLSTMSCQQNMNQPVGGDAFCFCFVMEIFTFKGLINSSVLVGATSPLARLHFLCYWRNLTPVPDHPRGSSYYHSHCGETETQCVKAATKAGQLSEPGLGRTFLKCCEPSTVCNPSHWTAEEGGMPHIKVSLNYMIRSCLKNTE